MDTLVAGIQQGVREIAPPDNRFVAKAALGSWMQSPEREHEPI